MSCNIKCVLWLLPINELALIQPTLQINRAIIAYLHLHFRQALPPNPRVCLCLCVHLSLSLLGLYGELVWLFSPSCPKSSVYLMLWPVDEGEEVPVGWSFWCFLQDRGGIFFGGREDFCSGLFFFFCKGWGVFWRGELSVGTLPVRLGFVFFVFFPQCSQEQADLQPMHARCTCSSVNGLRERWLLEAVWCVRFHLRVCPSASPQQPRVSWTRRRTSRWACLSLLLLSVSSSSSWPLSLSFTFELLLSQIFHLKALVFNKKPEKWYFKEVSWFCP